MAEIRRYVIENKDGSIVEYEFDTVEEAREAARAASLDEQVAVVARVFEYSDSELVEVWEDGAELPDAYCFPFTEKRE